MITGIGIPTSHSRMPRMPVAPREVDTGTSGEHATGRAGSAADRRAQALAASFSTPGVPPASVLKSYVRPAFVP